MRRVTLPGLFRTRFPGLAEFGELRLAWHPSADIYRDSEGWVVKFELAGVRREDVQWGVTGRQLTIRGKRCDRCAIEAREAYSMEIVYNRFERTLELPCDAEGASISTDTQDGMFFVRLNTVTRRP